MQSIDSIETYKYRTSKYLVTEKEEIKCNTTIQKENTKEHYPNWLEIPKHPYRLLIIGGSGSEMFLYTKDPYEAKHQFLTNKRESTGLNHFNESHVLIKYSNDMDDIFLKIEKNSQNKKC